MPSPARSVHRHNIIAYFVTKCENNLISMVVYGWWWRVAAHLQGTLDKRRTRRKKRPKVQLKPPAFPFLVPHTTARQVPGTARKERNVHISAWCNFACSACGVSNVPPSMTLSPSNNCARLPSLKHTTHPTLHLLWVLSACGVSNLKATLPAPRRLCHATPSHTHLTQPLLPPHINSKSNHLLLGLFSLVVLA